MKSKILLSLVIGLLMVTSVLAVDIIDVDMDVNGGSIDITTNGIDHSTLHPNQVGETNTFSGAGDFMGNYHANEGSYGALGSYINVNSNVNGADFIMTDTQNFNVLSGNHNNNVIGYFYAHSSGNDNQVAMNLKSIGSMYVWSEATNPYSLAPLRGNLIEKGVSTTKDGVPKTNLFLGVATDGIVTMSNSNIWGWTNGETGTSSTNYGGGIRTVSATGNGNYYQSGFGVNSLTFNGFNFGAGSATLGATFNGGMTGTYSMSSS